MKDKIKKWLGISELELYVAYRKKIREESLECEIETQSKHGRVLREVDLKEFAEKMAQKYNRAMIKSLIKKVLAEDNNLR